MVTHVVFLHGWGASSASFAGIRSFFENTFPCIFVDFDCNPEVVMTLDDYVEFVEKKLIERRVTHCHIIAHSFGARVAVLLAKRNPHIVKRMVITGGAGLKPRFNLKTWVKIRAYKWFKIGRGSADYRVLSQTGKRTFQNIIRRDLSGEIAELTTPTLLIYGKNDRSTPPYMARRWAKLQKRGAVVKIYDFAGHFVFLDKPAKFIADAIRFIGVEND